MKKENQVNQSRRDLLKGLGTAAVAGAVVAGVSTQTVASESRAESIEPRILGFPDTQPIR